MKIFAIFDQKLTIFDNKSKFLASKKIFRKKFRKVRHPLNFGHFLTLKFLGQIRPNSN